MGAEGLVEGGGTVVMLCCFGDVCVLCALTPSFESLELLHLSLHWVRRSPPPLHPSLASVCCTAGATASLQGSRRTVGSPSPSRWRPRCGQSTAGSRTRTEVRAPLRHSPAACVISRAGVGSWDPGRLCVF